MDVAMRYNLTELVKQIAVFEFYRDGNLFYSVSGFKFPVPIADAGTATFKPEEKAIMLMRWLRPAVNAANVETSEAAR